MITGTVGFELREADGRLIRSWTQPMHSPLKAWLQHLLYLVNAAGVAIASVKDRTGTDRTLATTGTIITDFMLMNGAAGSTAGIVAGTTDTAVTISDNAMAALIAHGVGAGQLQYGANTISTAVTVAGSDVTFTISRVLTNGSGAAITVKEVGLHGETDYGATTADFLLVRDVTASTAVNNGQALTVTYTIKMSV